MNGATTDPCVNTINAPISTIVMIKGANQYFFRTFKKSQMSLTIDECFHDLKDSGEICAMVLSVFSVVVPFSPSS